MRVGLLADSAGNLDLLDRALTLLTGPLGCERIFFLGGAYDDIDAVLQRRSSMPNKDSGDMGFLSEVTKFLESEEGTPEPSATAEEVFGVPIVRVPERSSRHYQNENKVFELLSSALVLLVHFKGDLIKDDIANATLIFHGASAKAAVVQIGNRAFVTPGPLATANCVAVLSDEPSPYTFSVYQPDGTPVHSQRLTLGSGRKLTVK